jgi:hypothetical protein
VLIKAYRPDQGPARRAARRPSALRRARDAARRALRRDFSAKKPHSDG